MKKRIERGSRHFFRVDPRVFPGNVLTFLVDVLQEAVRSTCGREASGTHCVALGEVFLTSDGRLRVSVLDLFPTRIQL